MKHDQILYTSYSIRKPVEQFHKGDAVRDRTAAFPYSDFDRDGAPQRV